MTYPSFHTFHIPVMGLAFTIDSPIKVARFGISSVISIVEDRLVETMRKYYYPKANLEYFPIPTSEPDYRAKRITDYLNLVNHMVQEQVSKLKRLPFEKGAEIIKYFEMLPSQSPLKNIYNQFWLSTDDKEKQEMELYLRSQIMPGSIDVNVMTKTDKDNFDKQGALLENGSDAIAALRGYINSNVTNSSIVFSAGMNPRLYNYMEDCIQFDANEFGVFNKRIIIKVSDYRSAFIQGKYLAKKGIWVSEFRIESGLNCGGHAFATDGLLLGPILQEFKDKKPELIETMFELYKTALALKGKKVTADAPCVSISVQGGIGTHAECNLLHEYYNVQSTGWGTPFLLVPEATTVDDHTLDLLSKASESDVYLSNNSPLGVRFHYLRGTTSHVEKLARIKSGKPGSPCTEKHLAFNTEFTDKPICTASRKYQALKVAQLESQNLPKQKLERELSLVLDKECLCLGLSNSASLKYNEPFIKKLDAVTVCPGPNIAYFSRQVPLQTMVDHIYGRTNIIEDNNRPHMFISELRIYIKYFKELTTNYIFENCAEKQKKYLVKFCENLIDGISYYRNIPRHAIENAEAFDHSLIDAIISLNSIKFKCGLG